MQKITGTVKTDKNMVVWFKCLLLSLVITYCSCYNVVGSGQDFDPHVKVLKAYLIPEIRA